MTQAAGVAALTGFGVRVLTARGDDLTGRGSCGDSVHIRLHSVDPFPRRPVCTVSGHAIAPAIQEKRFVKNSAARPASGRDGSRHCSRRRRRSGPKRRSTPWMVCTWSVRRETNVAGLPALAPDLAPDRKEWSGKERYEVLKKVPEIRGGIGLGGMARDKPIHWRSAFKTGALNHSATHPARYFNYLTYPHKTRIGTEMAPNWHRSSPTITIAAPWHLV
jgi:hypothetical protein